MDLQAHWERVYRTRRPDEVSWYRAHLDVSLALIEESAPDHAARILDVGAGASTLVDDLLDRGHRNVSLLDWSESALAITKERLGGRAARVEWLCGDVKTLALPAARYDVWHDRAVFHFLTDAPDRNAYIAQLKHALRPGGRVVIATFAADGPMKCSGLDVVRYDSSALCEALGAEFRQVRHVADLHRTPSGGSQSFVYCCCEFTG
jgi:SAM-dependent methyltransferase